MNIKQMLSVYINYPNSRISVHHDLNCSRIRARNKPEQRIIRINSSDVEKELNSLRNKELKFTSKQDLNDVWVYIDLGNVSEEENLVITIQNILGGFYKPLANAKIEQHC